MLPAYPTLLTKSRRVLIQVSARPSIIFGNTLRTVANVFILRKVASTLGLHDIALYIISIAVLVLTGEVIKAGMARDVMLVRVKTTGLIAMALFLAGNLTGGLFELQYGKWLQLSIMCGALLLIYYWWLIISHRRSLKKQSM